MQLVSFYIEYLIKLNTRMILLIDYSLIGNFCVKKSGFLHSIWIDVNKVDTKREDT